MLAWRPLCHQLVAKLVWPGEPGPWWPHRRPPGHQEDSHHGVPATPTSQLAHPKEITAALVSWPTTVSGTDRIWARKQSLPINHAWWPAPPSHSSSKRGHVNCVRQGGGEGDPEDLKGGWRADPRERPGVTTRPGPKAQDCLWDLLRIAPDMP
jgi:hypothetical protein